MKKCILLLLMFLIIVSCKSVILQPKEEVGNKQTPAYKQQAENLEKGIYFRGVGNEPEWSLKISESVVEFTSLRLGFEFFSAPHVEPIRAMDANVKNYRVITELGTMSIQIAQQECINTMYGDNKPYTVRIEMVLGKTNQVTTFNGCGNYITDSRLHDIWVLEKLNGEAVSATNIYKELPNLEINSATNQFMGFTGCNRMNGTIFFEKGLLRFTNAVTTRIACGGKDKENEFFKALQSTTAYKVENMRLTVSNQSGVELVFKKVD